MKVISKVNKSNVKILDTLMQKNFLKAVDALKTDVVESQIMPFDTGNMQNRSMFLDDSKLRKGIVLIKVDTPYTRRLYFHPEFNFRKDKNPKAQGMWFVLWINGNKKLFLSVTFARLLRKDLQKYDTKGN